MHGHGKVKIKATLGQPLLGGGGGLNVVHQLDGVQPIGRTRYAHCTETRKKEVGSSKMILGWCMWYVVCGMFSVNC
jgi:hypothetical protein